MSRDDSAFGQFIGDSNGPAYRKTEERTGPPLSYVSEKLGSSIRLLHSVYQNVETYVPDDLPQPPAVRGSSFSTKADCFLSPAWSAFRYAVVAFLALHNMLALANDLSLFDRLLAMSHDDFDAWVGRVVSEGSVTG